MRSEHDKLMAEADKYKKNLRKIIDDLRNKYKNIITINKSKEWYIQLDDKVLNVDGDLLDLLRNISNEKINYSKNQLKWWEEYYNLKLNKIKNH